MHNSVSGPRTCSSCSTYQFPPSPQVVSSEKALCEYNKADICVALCRMVAYNIGQLAHLNATRHGIKRILFGGFFIRGHPYTMETISYAINFWSKVRRASAAGALRRPGPADMQSFGTSEKPRSMCMSNSGTLALTHTSVRGLGGTGAAVSRANAGGQRYREGQGY